MPLPTLAVSRGTVVQAEPRPHANRLARAGLSWKLQTARSLPALPSQETLPRPPHAWVTTHPQGQSPGGAGERRGWEGVPRAQRRGRPPFTAGSSWAAGGRVPPTGHCVLGQGRARVGGRAVQAGIQEAMSTEPQAGEESRVGAGGGGLKRKGWARPPGAPRVEVGVTRLPDAWGRSGSPGRAGWVSRQQHDLQESPSRGEGRA